MGPTEGSGMAKRAGGEEEGGRPGCSDAGEVTGSGGGRSTAPRPQARLQTPAAAGAARRPFGIRPLTQRERKPRGEPRPLGAGWLYCLSLRSSGVYWVIRPSVRALFGLLLVALSFIPNGRSPSCWDNLPLSLTPPRREGVHVLDILLATRGRSDARRALEPLLTIDWLEAVSVTSASGGAGEHFRRTAVPGVRVPPPPGGGRGRASHSLTAA